MKNQLLGMDDTYKYSNYEIDISDVEKIYMSSDGFYSLLLPEGQPDHIINNAKKDDMTLLMISLKQR